MHFYFYFYFFKWVYRSYRPLILFTVQSNDFVFFFHVQAFWMRISLLWLQPLNKMNDNQNKLLKRRDDLKRQNKLYIFLKYICVFFYSLFLSLFCQPHIFADFDITFSSIIYLKTSSMHNPMARFSISVAHFLYDIFCFSF